MQDVKNPIVVIEYQNPFPTELTQSFSTKGWDPHFIRFQDRSHKRSDILKEAKAIIVSLVTDPKESAHFAMQIRKDSGLDRIPIFIIGGDNEVVVPLKQQIPRSCFVEPGTFILALKHFIPELENQN